MKKLDSFTRWLSMHLMPGLAVILLALIASHPACGDINMTLNLDRNDGNFRGSIYMYTDGPSDPITYHRIESPNGIIFRNVGNNFDSSYSNLTFSALMNECTNGLWTLTVNKDDPSEEQYGFAVSIANVMENMFGDTSVTNPANATMVATNQPLIEWTSTSLLPEVHIQIHNGFQPPEPGNYADLVAPTNSFIPPSPVLGGDNYIYLAYQSNDFSGITISVPTNSSAVPVSDWVSSADLSSYDSSNFTAPGGGGDPFDVAVESPGFTWSSYGDAGWFVSSTDYSVGSSALESGDLLFNYGSSTLEAMAIGPGTVSFDWALFADYGDSFDFYAVADSYGGDYDYFYYEGSEAYGWDSYTVDLEPGTNWLSWTFYNDDLDENDLNAAFLDNVEYSPSAPEYDAEFALNIQRVTRGTNEFYYMYPSLPYTYPGPVTTHEVSSPNGLSSSSIGSYPYDTLQALIDEIEDGDWTINFNEGHPENQEYTFTINVDDLTTNDLPLVTVLEPLDGATGVATNSGFSWIGPTSFDSLYVYAYDIGPNTSLGGSTLPVGDTSWPAGPALPEGTNSFDAYYTSNNFDGLTISEPMDYDFNYLSSWSTEVKLSTRGNARFVTGSGFVALPVTIFPPMLIGGDLGLSFVSQSGATHVVEWSTNLVTGPWMPSTNFSGDGGTNMVTLPATNPAAFFRVETQ